MATLDTWQKRVEALERSMPRTVARSGGGGIPMSLLDAKADKPSTLWLGSTLFGGAAGTPSVLSQGTTGAWAHSWALDAAVTERVATWVQFPPGWLTFDLSLYFSPLDATAGNIRWSCDFGALTAGAVVAPATTSAFTAASPAVTEQVTVAAAPASVAVPTGGLGFVSVARLGGDALDTYAADAGFIGLLLTKAS